MVKDGMGGDETAKKEKRIKCTTQGGSAGWLAGPALGVLEYVEVVE